MNYAIMTRGGMMNIKSFALGFFCCVGLIGIIVFAQNTRSQFTYAESDQSFTRIEFKNRAGNVAQVNMYVSEIRMDNGASCYFITPESSVLNLSSLGQIVG